MTTDTATWAEQGYLLVPGVLDADELAELRAETDRLATLVATDEEASAHGRYVAFESEADGYELTSGHARADQVRMIEPLVDLSPPFAALSRRDALTAPARDVLSDDVLLFEDKLNYKLPGGAGFVWHQDWSCCWRAHTDDLVTCFIYLDDSTIENGCLQILPGSHSEKVVRPFAGESTFRVELADGEQELVTPLPLEAGDMVVFDPYLLHYSEPNRTDTPRRAIVYTYSAARHGDLWRVRYPELAR